MHDALDELADAPGIVIDVRPNSGGDELVARRFAERFVAERAVYSKNRYRDAAAAEGWGPMYDRAVDAGPEGKRYRGRAVVLMGPANMSSCESFLLMMRHGAKAELIGEKSWGSSGNPKPLELSCGVTVVLSSWQDFDVDGTMIERKGIEPDVVVKATAETLRAGDPVIEEGLRRVRGAVHRGGEEDAEESKR
jgi:C-terminal processing protease CtpA/Prc